MSDHVPLPDLRIVPTASLHPHETTDSQRLMPLIERIRADTVVINPPVVAPLHDDDAFVVLDGANRTQAFSALGYPHALVQVAPYDSGFVELKTWHHVVCAWDEGAFLANLAELPEIRIERGQHADAIAHLILRDFRVLSLSTPLNIAHERTAALCKVVDVYQQHAVLQRTPLPEPTDNWHLYPDAIALVVFPALHPADIMAAAREHVYLPPGISRHIIHGRAINVNYPLDRLRDTSASLSQKNADLLAWMREKMAQREVRYYEEATYQFGE